MTVRIKRFLFVLAAAALAASALGARVASAAAQNFVDQDAEAALQSLYSTSPAAKTLSEQAKGILVFPIIGKGGFIVGIQGGDGVLFQKGEAVAHYSATAVSVGYQAGIQSYSYALFFMTDADLSYLRKSRGWSLGSGPHIVVVDVGLAKDVSTLTLQKGVYAFVFDQKGLMAGSGIVGQKIYQLK